MRKKVGIIKRVFCISLIFLLSINSFAAIVSDNDGSAFITKAEFDALKSSFQAQIDTYNNSIDSKVDGAIASYLAGIKIVEQAKLHVDIINDDIIYKQYIHDQYAGTTYANQHKIKYTLQAYMWGSEPRSRYDFSGALDYFDLGVGYGMVGLNSPYNSNTYWGGGNYVPVLTTLSRYDLVQVYNNASTTQQTYQWKNLTSSFGVSSLVSSKMHGFPIYFNTGKADVMHTITGSPAFEVQLWNGDYPFSSYWSTLVNPNNLSISSTSPKPLPERRFRGHDYLIEQLYTYGGIGAFSVGPSSTILATFKTQWSHDDTGTICRGVPNKIQINPFGYNDQISWKDGSIKLIAKWNYSGHVQESTLKWAVNWTNGYDDTGLKIAVKPEFGTNFKQGTIDKSSYATGTEHVIFDSQTDAAGLDAGTLGFMFHTDDKLINTDFPFKWIDYYGLGHVDLAYELYNKEGDLQTKKYFWQNGAVVTSALYQ